MYWLVATPAGTLTMISRSARVRPSPRHFLHGDWTIRPSPLHVGQGATVTNCPKNDRCARRTSPAPLHVPHTWLEVPGSAPHPVHPSQLPTTFTLTFRPTPLPTPTT